MPEQMQLCRSVVIVCCIALIAFSCKNNIPADEHPDFVNAILKKTGEAQEKYQTESQSKYIDEALHFIDSAFKTLPAPGTGDIYAKDSIFENKYRYIKHDYVKAMACLDNMLLAIRGKTAEEKYAERYAIILYHKGQAFRELKKYDEALYYTSRAELAVLKFVKNKCNLSRYSGWKANLMFEQEKYLASASAYLQQSRFLRTGCNDGSFYQLISIEAAFNNAAISYLRAGVPDSAAYCMDTALQIIATIEQRYPSNEFPSYAKAVVYAGKADMLVLRGSYTEARDLYKKSIARTYKRDTGFTQATYTGLANLYLKENNNEAALQTLEQLRISLDHFNNEKPAIEWYKLMAKYYAQTKQLDMASNYQQLYMQFRDSVETRDKKFMAVNIEKEFENLGLEHANEILQKESRFKTIYLTITVLIFIIIAAAAVFTWHNLRQTRKLHQHMKQQNDEMQIALASLEQSHQDNNRIIRLVVHDLKHPVSTINNLVFSLLRKEISEELRETLDLIKKACSNSMMLVNDALLQNKKSATSIKELVNLKRLLEYCVDLLQTKAAEKNQRLHLLAEDVSIMLNRQKMWRAISNIVNNAIKFSPEHTSIDITLQRTESSILLSVHDNGIGIPENLKDKIFTLSPEASRPGTFGEQSYGLGLSISQKIIEEHQGKIWFESKSGKGSVFYVELPCEN